MRAASALSTSLGLYAPRPGAICDRTTAPASGSVPAPRLALAASECQWEYTAAVSTVQPGLLTANPAAGGAPAGRRPGCGRSAAARADEGQGGGVAPDGQRLFDRVR